MVWDRKGWNPYDSNNQRCLVSFGCRGVIVVVTLVSFIRRCFRLCHRVICRLPNLIIVIISVVVAVSLIAFMFIVFFFIIYCNGKQRDTTGDCKPWPDSPWRHNLDSQPLVLPPVRPPPVRPPAAPSARPSGRRPSRPSAGPPARLLRPPVRPSAGPPACRPARSFVCPFVRPSACPPLARPPVGAIVTTSRSI